MTDGSQIDGRRGYVNKAHIQEQRVYRKDLAHTVPTEVAAVPFTTEEEVQGEEQEQAQEQEVQREVEEQEVPFSTSSEGETHLPLEDLQTRQPDQVPSKLEQIISLLPSKHVQACQAVLEGSVTILPPGPPSP